MNIQEKIKEFFKEVYVEMRRVSWLSKNDIIKYTAIVLVVTIVVSFFLGGLDYIFSSAIKMFIFK
jgi:preprotein translocase subunit SecE